MSKYLVLLLFFFCACSPCEEQIGQNLISKIELSGVSTITAGIPFDIPLSTTLIGSELSNPECEPIPPPSLESESLVLISFDVLEDGSYSFLVDSITVQIPLLEIDEEYFYGVLYTFEEAGNYRIEVITDYKSQIEEINEDDNITTGYFEF